MKHIKSACSAYLLCLLCILLTGCQTGTQTGSQQEQNVSQPAPEAVISAPEEETESEPESSRLLPGLPELSDDTMASQFHYSSEYEAPSYFSRLRYEEDSTPWARNLWCWWDEASQTSYGYAVTRGSEAQYPQGLSADSLYLYRSSDGEEQECYWLLLDSPASEYGRLKQYMYYINSDRSQLIRVNPFNGRSSVLYVAEENGLFDLTFRYDFLLFVARQPGGRYAVYRYYEPEEDLVALESGLPSRPEYTSYNNCETLIRWKNPAADEILENHRQELWQQWWISIGRLANDIPDYETYADETSFDTSVYTLIQAHYGEPEYYISYQHETTGYHRTMGYVSEGLRYYCSDGSLWQQPYETCEDDVLDVSQFWMYLPSE